MPLRSRRDRRYRRYRRYHRYHSARRHRALLAFECLVAGLFAALLPGSGGCASRPIAPTETFSPRRSSASAHNSALVGTNTIEQSPAYRQAIASYARKDYRGALVEIDTLLQTPSLSPSALGFLQHQRSLCQDAISGRKASAAASTASAVSASARPLRSAANADCGPRALLIVCQDLKIPASLDALRKAAGTTADGTSMAGLVKAAHSVGLKADGVQMDRNALSNLSKPALAWTNGNHYIAVLSVHHSLMDLSVNGDAADESSGFIATVHDPNKPGEEEMPLAGPTGLLARSGGMLLLLSRENPIASAAVPTH